MNPTPPEEQPSNAEASDAEDAKRVAADQLNAFAESERVQTLLDALDHHFDGEFSRHTYEEVWDSGNLLIGSEGFGAIAWAADGNSQEKIELLELTPPAKELVMRICALYGSRLKRTFELSELFEKKADDWESYGRRIYRRVTGEGYLIETVITKYNGDEFVMSAGLASAVRLSVQALKTLLAVDDLSEIEDEDRTELQDTLAQVAERIAAEQQTADSPSND